MIKKILLFTAAGVLTLVGGAIGFLELRSPHTAPPRDTTVEMTPARVERGKYLYEYLMHCDGCHGQNDYTRFASPVVPGRSGVGFVFPRRLDSPAQLPRRTSRRIKRPE